MTKKLTFILLMFTVGAPIFVDAATLTISPTSGTFEVGKTYTVNVGVNPGTSKIYTTKINLKYPSDLVAVENFSLNGSWMPLVQPGYDLIDNTNGVLIKTGGYTSGLTNTSTFGSITFLVKAKGQASIVITNDSMLLNELNQNTFTGLSNAIFTFNISTKLAAPIVKDAVKTKSTAMGNVSQTQVNKNSSSTINQDVAAIGVSTQNATLYWILALAICSGIFFYVGFMVSKKTKV